jgi:hypothetical protein
VFASANANRGREALGPSLAELYPRTEDQSNLEPEQHAQSYRVHERRRYERFFWRLKSFFTRSAESETFLIVPTSS